ncbi:hypothetical protein HMPREF3188_00744 [Tissierellia bacterium KA00581]|nr:hypothetical protein HMPREF3188_00744 [Tissierellia bacterium KA00581]
MALTRYNFILSCIFKFVNDFFNNLFLKIIIISNFFNNFLEKI